VGAVFLRCGSWCRLRHLPSDTHGERCAARVLRAIAAAGTVVILVVILGFVVKVAQGEDPSPYAEIGAVGGVAYIAALAWLRRRL
jgi:Na+/melibiose symporter-like transporter